MSVAEELADKTFREICSEDVLVRPSITPALLHSCLIPQDLAAESEAENATD